MTWRAALGMFACGEMRRGELYEWLVDWLDDKDDAAAEAMVRELLAHENKEISEGVAIPLAVWLHTSQLSEEPEYEQVSERGDGLDQFRDNLILAEPPQQIPASRMWRITRRHK